MYLPNAKNVYLNSRKIFQYQIMNRETIALLVSLSALQDYCHRFLAECVIKLFPYLWFYNIDVWMDNLIISYDCQQKRKYILALFQILLWVDCLRLL